MAVERGREVRTQRRYETRSTAASHCAASRSQEVRMRHSRTANTGIIAEPYASRQRRTRRMSKTIPCALSCCRVGYVTLMANAHHVVTSAARSCEGQDYTALDR